MNAVSLIRQPNDPDWLTRRERLKLWLLGWALNRDELVVVCHAMENHAKLVASQRRDYTESERSKALLDGRLVTVRRLYYKARLILREAGEAEGQEKGGAPARSRGMARCLISIGLMVAAAAFLVLSEQETNTPTADLLASMALLSALVSILVGLWPRHLDHHEDCN